jgi:hypothetical protein
MKVDFNKTGAERKTLVTAMADILGTKAKYIGVPSFAYQIGNFTVDKNGVAEFDDNIFPKDIRDLLERLAEQGFVGQTDALAEEPKEVAKEEPIEPQSEELGITIAMPIGKVAVGNLTCLLKSKGELIKKALGVEDIRIEIDEEKVSFPWFREVAPAEALTYTRFISALCEMSVKQKRINNSKKDVANEKYAFRCFLLRLGFIGDEFKADRKILLSKLDGSSAFKDGAKKGGEQ